MIKGRTALAVVTMAAFSTAANAAVTISSAATANMSCSKGVCAPTAVNAVLNAGDLESFLASGSVTVTTTGSGVQAIDVQIVAPVTWKSPNALSLAAYHSINVDQAVSVTGLGSLSVTINDGGKGGIFVFGSKGRVAFSFLSSQLTIDGAPYTLVNTVKDLANAVAAHPGGDYALANDYSAGKDGTYNSSPVSTTFTGRLNGLGNIISYLSVNDANQSDDVGLFREIKNPGYVGSLRLSHVNMKAIYSLGGITGLNDGYLLNDYVQGSLSASGFVGGLVGLNYGTVRQGNAAATVEGETVGGLVGYNCSDCFSLPGIVEYSRASGTVIVATENPGSGGGLVGGNYGTIESSWATGSVSGNADAEVGGLVGGSNGSGIVNSYATGSVYGGEAGGLVGASYDYISDSYSTGTVSGPSGSTLGGFIGFDEAPSGHLTDCYWDETTSEISNPDQGAGNKKNDPGITGLTTTQLQSGLPSGFKSTIWHEKSYVNDGMPYLIANPPQ
ncbi:MAG TPA: GLUG motif-containing protein [Rhizomicrobium sp.]|jgi:hypothetical protein|nr:GLUG motif-containing protein [Rhizomicrobium sp.]